MCSPGDPLLDAVRVLHGKLGPTASGKTALAMALADCWPCRIISVDSAQIYRGMDIGTAKPDASSLQRYPHALIDLIDPENNVG